MFFIILNNKPIFDNRMWYAPWLFKGEHCSLAGLSTSGTLTHWFKNEFAKDIKTENAFELLAKEAEKITFISIRQSRLKTIKTSAYDL